MGSGSTLKNIVTFGAYGQREAQSEATAVQQRAQQQAYQYQQQAMLMQMQQMSQMQNYYNQQALMQEREVQQQEQQQEIVNNKADKLKVEDVHRQSVDRNTADLTKGNANTAPVIQAELKGESDPDEMVERWY